MQMSTSTCSDTLCSHRGCTSRKRGRLPAVEGFVYCISHKCIEGSCGRIGLGKDVKRCKSHGGGKRCLWEGCKTAAQGGTAFCISHGGGKRCQFSGCHKAAQGKTQYCVSHGGTSRGSCMRPGCSSKSVGLATPFCVRHGGGKRCAFEGCKSGAEGKTLYCVKHGGGKRCGSHDCTNAAQGSTNFCINHGGGRLCEVEGCSRSSQGSSGRCVAHEGGNKCVVSGCNMLVRKSKKCKKHQIHEEDSLLTPEDRGVFPVLLEALL